MYIKNTSGCTLTERKLNLIIETICFNLKKYGPQTERHLVNGFHVGVVEWLSWILFEMYSSGLIKADLNSQGVLVYEARLSGLWAGFKLERRRKHFLCE